MITIRSFLFTTLIIGSLITAQAQIHIVDEVKKEIFQSGKNTVYNIGSSILTDGQIKLHYRSSVEDDKRYAEIYVKNEDDFNVLYDIVIDVFDKKPELPIKIDLGDSYLRLYYTGMLFGYEYVSFGHAYKSSPYDEIRSQRINLKDIKKLFGKTE